MSGQTLIWPYTWQLLHTPQWRIWRVSLSFEAVSLPFATYLEVILASILQTTSFKLFISLKPFIRSVDAYLLSVVVYAVLILTSQISIVTLDNVSNNDTMMASLESQFKVLGIPFNKDGNWIWWVTHIFWIVTQWFRCHTTKLNRCFPHIINIAVQMALKTLLASSADLLLVAKDPKD